MGNSVRTYAVGDEYSGFFLRHVCHAHNLLWSSHVISHALAGDRSLADLQAAVGHMNLIFNFTFFLQACGVKAVRSVSDPCLWCTSKCQATTVGGYCQLGSGKVANARQRATKAA